MIKTTAFIGLGLCVLLLSGCAPKIDGSSAKAFEDSLVKITAGLDSEKRALFTAAVDVLVLKAPQSNELSWDATKRTMLSGKTADSVISEATDIAIRESKMLQSKIISSHRPKDSDVLSNLVITNPRVEYGEQIDRHSYSVNISLDVENKNPFDVDGFCASVDGSDLKSPVQILKANVNFGGDNKTQGVIRSGTKRRLLLRLLRPQERQTFSECQDYFFYSDFYYKLYSGWHGDELGDAIRFADHASDSKDLSIRVHVMSVYTPKTRFASYSACSDGEFTLNQRIDHFLTLIKYKR